MGGFFLPPPLTHLVKKFPKIWPVFQARIWPQLYTIWAMLVRFRCRGRGRGIPVLFICLIIMASYVLAYKKTPLVAGLVCYCTPEPYRLCVYSNRSASSRLDNDTTVEERHANFVTLHKPEKANRQTNKGASLTDFLHTVVTRIANRCSLATTRTGGLSEQLTTQLDELCSILTTLRHRLDCIVKGRSREALISVQLLHSTDTTHKESEGDILLTNNRLASGVDVRHIIHSKQRTADKRLELEAPGRNRNPLGTCTL